jgi:hypothetical protein
MTVMTQYASTHESRQQAARSAWSELPHGGRQSVRLDVQCAHGHHVAAVYDTPAGWVFVAPVRGHSHGSRDRVDEPHGSHAVDTWIDLIAPVDDLQVDDSVPAWCDCGPRTLSRAAMLEWIAAGEHRVVVD